MLLLVSDKLVALAIPSTPAGSYTFHRTSSNNITDSLDIVVSKFVLRSNIQCAKLCSHNRLCFSFVTTDGECLLLNSWDVRISLFHETIYKKKLYMTLSDVKRV